MRRNWLAVARKDVADASRSWMVYVLTALLLAVFVVLVIGQGLTYPQRPNFPDQPHTRFAFSQLVSLSGLLVPLVALVVGYLAVAGEQEAGSLRLLLGHPVTRRDVLVGKFLGRTAVMWAALAVPLGVVGAGIPLLYRGFDAVAYAGLVGLILLLATGFVAVAVGLSAATRSRALSMGGAISTFVATVIAWEALPLSVFYLLNGDTPATRLMGPDPVPGWFLLLARLRPQRAFDVSGTAYLLPENDFMESASDAVGQYTVEAGDPIYAEPWFGLVILLAWVAVPLALGYRRFAAADLG